MKRPNGSGTVYKLGGRRRRPWIVRKDGKIIGYYATKHEGMEALEAIAGRPLSDAYNYTFKDVYEHWSSEHFRKDITQHQKDEYVRSFDRLACFHNRKMRDLKTADYQEFLDNYTPHTYSCLLRFKTIIKLMCDWAMREQIITVNPGSFLQLPPKNTPEKKIFSDLEIEKLKQDNNDFSRAIVAMIYTGLRINEFCQLPMTAYHDTYIIAGEKTEAGKNRVIPLSPTAKKYLDYFVNKARAENSDIIIPWKSDNFRIHYYETLERLGIERKTPHSTRHTFASICRREGMPPEVLQRIIGHANYQTTANTYVHSDTDALINAIQAIG